MRRSIWQLCSASTRAPRRRASTLGPSSTTLPPAPTLLSLPTLASFRSFTSSSTLLLGWKLPWRLFQRSKPPLARKLRLLRRAQWPLQVRSLAFAAMLLHSVKSVYSQAFPCPFTPVSLPPLKALSPAQCLHQSEPCVDIAAELALGPFTILPSTGTIEAGAVATLSATFSAAGSQVFAEMLGIDVQNRSYTDCPEGIPFELIGESCIPGIDCQRVEGIFEEHVIKKELDAFNGGNNEYGMRDKVRVRSSAPDDVAHLLACGLPWWLGKDHHLGANARLTLGQSSQGTMTSSAVLLQV